MIAAVVSSIFNMAKPDAARPSIMITAIVLIIFNMTNILLVEFVGSFLLNCGSVFCCSIYCENYSGMRFCVAKLWMYRLNLRYIS
jgi:hypothetical protein